jgi:hypothetical protein
MLFSCAGNTTVANDSPPVSRQIVLDAPSRSELRGGNAGKGGQPAQVGFGRPLPTQQQLVMLHDLKWQRAPSGGYRAAVVIRSPSAKSLRVGMKLSGNVPGLNFDFTNRRDPATSVPASTVAAGSQSGGTYWSPLVAGDTVWIEMRSAAIPAIDVRLQLPTISHIQ